MEKTLTFETAKKGTLVQNIKNPEWGTWRITEKELHALEIQGDRGAKMIFDHEFRFWKLVN